MQNSCLEMFAGKLQGGLYLAQLSTPALGFFIATVGPCQLHSTQPTYHLKCPLGLQQ